MIKNSLGSLEIVLFGLLVDKNIEFFFNKTSLKLDIDNLLDNCYFTLINICFHQLTGILWGLT